MKRLLIIPALLGIAILTWMSASAAATVVVTPANTQGWSESITAAGEINYVADPTSPYPGGALQLKTGEDTSDKALYMKAVGIPLSELEELSYHTRQLAGPPHAGPSFQLVVLLGGDSGFTTLVFEPYWNGSVEPDEWQEWDVASGQFWSSSTFNNEVDCVVAAGAGGPPFYSLQELADACPNAVVGAIGVNVGSFNPGYDVLVDGVTLNGTTYDFELFAIATDKDHCKNGGWAFLARADGSGFKNQGNCIQYVNTGR